MSDTSTEETIESKSYTQLRNEVLETLTDHDTTYMPEYAGLALDKLIQAHTAQRLSELKEKIKEKGLAHSIPEDMYCNGYNSALNEILQLIEDQTNE